MVAGGLAADAGAGRGSDIDTSEVVEGVERGFACLMRVKIAFAVVLRLRAIWSPTFTSAKAPLTSQR